MRKNSAAAFRSVSYEKLLEMLPFLFFGLQLLFTLKYPPIFSFDEFHYVPAAKELITLQSNRNWEHPPLGKYLLGISWLVFHQWTGLLSELTSMRLICIVFGLLILAAVRAWMSHLKFSAGLRLAVVWMVGFSMIWFVQSKTAMLDVFYLALGLWGLLFVAQKKMSGFALLGLAMGAKWSALPFVVMAMFFARSWGVQRFAKSLALMGSSYLVLFVPYLFLQQGPLDLSGFITYQFRMLGGLESTSEREHSYKSAWWQWPTLMRPMWYTFSKTEASAGAANPSYYAVFMGGNPVLFWLGNAALVYLAVMAALNKTVRQDRRSLFILAMFVLPMIVWILTPRKLMFFYYILPSCLWYGPALVMAASYITRTQRALSITVWSLVVAQGLVFFYMLPILTGQALSWQAFQTFYQSWMWRLNWI